MSNDPFDPVPGQRAAIEQLRMEAPNVAEALWAFYEAFREAGFNETQAMMLVAPIFMSTLTGGGE